MAAELYFSFICVACDILHDSAKVFAVTGRRRMRAATGTAIPQPSDTRHFARFLERRVGRAEYLHTSTYAARAVDMGRCRCRAVGWRCREARPAHTSFRKIAATAINTTQ